MRAYWAQFVRESDKIVVTFPHLPFGVTQGDDEADARTMAHDAVLSVIHMLMRDREALPADQSDVRKRGKGYQLIHLSAMESLKCDLYEAMREQKVTKAALARKLNANQIQMDRLLNLFHASKMEQLEAALSALGLRVTAGVERAA